ncbi:uncharacterized protein LY89DRAFT_736581 [Mollisia scopiformis]|uniref:Uncharacterized protein n=1 Tax=Mollisia scopiformis TaxID=149040 RepID=A0A194X2Y8_MOLSC|nr:uncharacterized protein LY89DRAFT_736581 [Mollisia scopiformis]KUJ14550.1 hypothetical protein LY89DRAFT_736581 [Mollisia scopiformis]
MASIPSAVAGKILRNFVVISGSAVGGVFAVYEIFNIAIRKQMAENERGHLKIYNTIVHPEQDRLDTIFDRTKLLNQAKEKKPWNRTLAEKERVRT